MINPCSVLSIKGLYKVPEWVLIIVVCHVCVCVGNVSKYHLVLEKFDE
jgi:hypothetical protein